MTDWLADWWIEYRTLENLNRFAFQLPFDSQQKNKSDRAEIAFLRSNPMAKEILQKTDSHQFTVVSNIIAGIETVFIHKPVFAIGCDEEVRNENIWS